MFKNTTFQMNSGW